MKTWAKQLEDALPNADKGFVEDLMNDCPRLLFGEDAPEYTGDPFITDGHGCKSCWDSCDSKCRYMMTAMEDGDRNETH